MEGSVGFEPTTPGEGPAVAVESRCIADGLVFQSLIRRAGLERIRFHDLRHTAATLMLSRGIHPKVVSEMMGHSQISTTLDLYSHVTPTMQREAAEAMEALVGRSGSWDAFKGRWARRTYLARTHTAQHRSY
jgi:hypothetical protein